MIRINQASISYTSDNKPMYTDMYGNVLHNGDIIRMNGHNLKMVYESEDGSLGTDATNPSWLESGRAYRCEYGIYPLNISDLQCCELIAHINNGVRQ